MVKVDFVLIPLVWVGKWQIRVISSKIYFSDERPFQDFRNEKSREESSNLLKNPPTTTPKKPDHNRSPPSQTKKSPRVPHSTKCVPSITLERTYLIASAMEINQYNRTCVKFSARLRNEKTINQIKRNEIIIIISISQIEKSIKK